MVYHGQLKALLLNIVLLAEAFYTAGCVNELLFAGKEGVAGGTNFNLEIFNGRTCFNDIAAGTGNLAQLVFRMNLLFHAKSSSTNH